MSRKGPNHKPIFPYKRQIGKELFIGLFDIKNWWYKEQITKAFPIAVPTDYVVGEFIEYDDGFQEGLTTIASFRKFDDAQTFFKKLEEQISTGGKKYEFKSKKKRKTK